MYCCENKTGPEAQQKALAEARVIIANNQIKDVDTGTTQIASSETKKRSHLHAKTVSSAFSFH